MSLNGAGEVAFGRVGRIVLALGGLGLTAGFALAEGWTLPEFCWSTWLGGLVFAWAGVLAAVVEIPLRARADWDALAARIPALARVPGNWPVVLLAVAGCAAGWLMFHVYSWLFGFYGLFLSVFARMEPEDYFGPNGFINSDFYSPVMFLLERFWPMVAGVLLANAGLLWGTRPWERLVLPIKAGQMVRLHLMVLLLPLFAMLAWALLGDAYHGLAIVLLLVVLYGSSQRGQSC